MAEKYNPQAIEAKWRAKWPEKRESYELSPGEEPYYTLDMISYPSSEGLHMGHWRPYTIADVWARYQTMLGKKVLHPVGFDAFGLPAENAAINNNTHPAVYTKRSVDNFTRQIKEMGKMYDWSTVINTSDPSYYKWTQWLFLQLYKHGLAYRASGLVNWCPSCQTVLANEQVITSECERCGSKVVKKALKQWYFKITDFAEALLDFDKLDWPERVKHSQINWIGKSEGATLRFTIEGSDQSIEVFTTRPDTIFGATYLVLSPEHSLLERLKSKIENWDEVRGYIEKSEEKTDIERQSEEKQKTGVELKGLTAMNPINNKALPIWIADYVIASYGTGAIMAVPAHDQRDFEFAKQLNLPIRQVIQPMSQQTGDEAYTGSGTMINSGEFNGKDSTEASQEIVEQLAKAGLAQKEVRYRLRDWLVSRQRYWGAPIPIIYCDTCGEQLVLESELPVLLPKDAEFMLTGGSPLERHPTFKQAICPKCGKPATRETDTLDTFVDSSWYYLRFTSPHLETKAFNEEVVRAWLPVDFYVGGVEHSILHLLYSRFIMKALKQMELVPYDEPFQTFLGNGMIYLHGKKMSKSKGNVVNPDELVQSYGTDALRGYVLFVGPADQDVEWQTNGINGVGRFLSRAWTFLTSGNHVNSQDILPLTHKLVKSVTDDLNTHSFNTVVSSLMSYLHEVTKVTVNIEDKQVFAKLLAPIFPHFAEEIWQRLGGQKSVFENYWPTYEPGQIKSEKVTIVIQVNGKTRGTIQADPSVSQEEVEALVKKDRPLAGKQPSRVVYVPGRLINFVLE